ncbi:FeoB-associated Cys-rich membrane protein [Clostridium haemolyticum]|uniref:FeoB-associated Cys-rich membrane protein n=1 Tax=Clostridium haemolyticum TaxID=84025 RepID=UPI000FFB88CD|nr:FeoB-associated Cys-rich membrane protein [Clostridium haemolyticum]
MEKLFVIILGILAVFILVRSFKKKASGGGCDCGSCSSHCAMYNLNSEKKRFRKR